MQNKKEPTISNITQFTFTEIIDYVIDKISEQGDVSFEGKNCLYRKHEICGSVKKCAIGHLIPDEEYRTSIEWKPISSLIYDGILEINADEKEKWEYVALLSLLQDAHDEAAIKSESPLEKCIENLNIIKSFVKDRNKTIYEDVSLPEISSEIRRCITANQ